MLMVMRLQQRFRIDLLVVLILSLFGILAIRFYIFYMVAVTVAGSFIVGTSYSRQSILQRATLLVLIGLGLTYFGVLRTASVEIERYADLERIQLSRSDLARSAESGFGEDIDVSTPEGALTAIPVGFTYLMFAPFPWQASNLRQALAVPETFLWWAMMPFMVAGIWYAVRHRLRTAFPILLFSLMLTLAYSIFQGNVGTAYRQRTQIQVFLFMFIAVGWALYKEKRDDKRALRLARDRELQRRLQVRV
jgi:hypothetical protein